MSQGAPLAVALVGLIKLALSIFAAMRRVLFEPTVRQQFGELLSRVLRKRIERLRYESLEPRFPMKGPTVDQAVAMKGKEMLIEIVSRVGLIRSNSP